MLQACLAVNPKNSAGIGGDNMTVLITLLSPTLIRQQNSINSMNTQNFQNSQKNSENFLNRNSETQNFLQQYSSNENENENENEINEMLSKEFNTVRNTEINNNTEISSTETTNCCSSPGEMFSGENEKYTVQNNSTTNSNDDNCEKSKGELKTKNFKFSLSLPPN